MHGSPTSPFHRTTSIADFIMICNSSFHQVALYTFTWRELASSLHPHPWEWGLWFSVSEYFFASRSAQCLWCSASLLILNVNNVDINYMNGLAVPTVSGSRNVFLTTEHLPMHTPSTITSFQLIPSSGLGFSLFVFVYTVDFLHSFVYITYKSNKITHKQTNSQICPQTDAFQIN